MEKGKNIRLIVIYNKVLWLSLELLHYFGYLYRISRKEKRYLAKASIIKELNLQKLTVTQLKQMYNGQIRNFEKDNSEKKINFIIQPSCLKTDLQN